MKKNVLKESQINYNVYNALNLYNEELGKSYIQNNFNPFYPSFELNENFVIERFLNSAKNPEIVEPAFISLGTQKTKEAFEQSANNCQSMLAEIDAKINDPNLSDSLKEELKKLKIYLLCRIELLNINIKNLRKNKNALKMYENVERLDLNLANLFKESYTQMFNIQIAINAYLENVKYTSAAYKKEMENKRLIEKAKQIIKSNQQQQEQTQILQEQPKKSAQSKDELSEIKTQLQSKQSTSTKQSQQKGKTNSERSI